MAHRKIFDLVGLGSFKESDWCGVAWALVDPDKKNVFTLKHSVPEENAHLLPKDDRADHAVPSFLLYAMQQGVDLRVHGKVSPLLLDGLDTLQSIWQRWRPERYQPVEIIVDQELKANPVEGERGGLFAFSGGVDASFSLFRHLQQAAGRTNRKPSAALLVHGMDIPLDRTDFFDGALLRANRILDETGVPLIPIRTNSRQLGLDWEDSFGIHLISCFLCFQKQFRFSVKGSEEPYDALIMPWGSTPLTDHLLSTESMLHIHDGAQFDRTEKVDWLFQNTKVVDELRVCWAGPSLDRNCGKCEKCVRTMLNFWAMGHKVPDAFPEKLTPSLVLTIHPQNEVQLRELKSLARYAADHHLADDKVFVALQKVLRRSLSYLEKKGARYSLRRILSAVSKLSK